MTRQLTAHISNPANDCLKITVLDEPGSGKANHAYLIEGYNSDSNPQQMLLGAELTCDNDQEGVVLLFQDGPISEVGVNGITHEALLAVLIDRLQSFQAGPYSCRENALALTKLEEALMWLNKRTQRRMAAGTEGTHEGD